MAGLIGCSLRELPERIGWDEWLLWRAWYQIEPWGENRADLRQSVGLAYTLAPYLPRGSDLPELTWPYYGDSDELTAEQVQAAAEAERIRWRDWEASRRRNRSDRSDKSDKSDRSDGSDRSDRSDKSDKSD